MVRHASAIPIASRLPGGVDTARIDAVLAGYDKPETSGPRQVAGCLKWTARSLPLAIHA
jgi:hypothetical protein